MKKIFKTGDKVTHKGHLWQVVYEDCGLVKIRRGEETKVVRVNQVRSVEDD
jgi:hypothetical protein